MSAHLVIRNLLSGNSIVTSHISLFFFKKEGEKKMTMVFTRGEDEADSGFGRTGLIQIPILRHF
jgi:hypothetical protein